MKIDLRVDFFTLIAKWRMPLNRKSAYVLMLSIAFLSPSGFTQSLDQLTKQAEMGDVQAQYQLAQHLATSDSIASPSKDAQYWLHEAAMGGQLDASIELAQQAHLSSADPDDFAEYTYPLMKLAASGDVDAQTALGQIYQNNKQISVDTKQLAQIWYRIAAEKSDDAEAAYAALLEQQFNQRRVKQLKQLEDLEPISDIQTEDRSDNLSQNASLGYQVAIAVLLLLSASLAFLLIKKRAQALTSSDELRETQLQATINQQNGVIKQQKRQLETLFRQFKKLEAKPDIPTPKAEPKDHKLGLAASMFGFRASSLPDEKQIKTRYKQLCKIYHPDLKGSDEEMKRLNAALKILLAHIKVS